MKTYNLTENLFWTAALAILAGGGAVQTKRRNRMLWAVVCLAELAAGGAAWAAELPWEWEGRMEFGGERSEWVVDLEGAPERV
ncbi:MAG: hypothetical protein IK066_04435, partial [Kiritimatiellae bacterium]|nr:hypothetical protein [Kiritimatiellia bacterium]